jgi:hypothetical protein
MVALLGWFLRSVAADATGRPGPAPEWPEPGGLAGQAPKTIEAYDLLREEMRWVFRGPRERDDTPPPVPDGPPAARRASARRG